MRAHACVFATMLLAGSAGAQPSAAPPLKINPIARPDADMVVRAVAARDLPPRVPAASRQNLDEVVRLLRANKVTEAREPWGRAVSVSGLRSPGDIDALVQWVLRESYLETNADLKSYADKVRYYNETKQALRDELAKVKRGQAARGITAEPYRLDGAAVKTERPRALSVPERDAYLKTLEEKLRSIGDDAQLANVDLQNALQKQQQTAQAMSAVSKMLHDVAMATIRKIGG